jgi:hypothetical protein
VEDEMRKTVFAAVIIAGLIAPVTVYAQSDSTTDKLIQDIRTDLKRDKIAIIGDAMGFTADQASKFWPIYKEYESEFTKVGDSTVTLIKAYGAQYETMTDEIAASLAKRNLELQQRQLDLRTKYYNRLVREISPVIAARFLQVDRRISLLVDLELATEIPLMPDAK